MIFGRRKERAETASGVVLRPLRGSDTTAVRRITTQAFEGVNVEENVEKVFGPLAGTRWAERKYEHIRRDISYWPRSAFVAEVAGEPVGFVTTALDRSIAVGHIRNLAVAPGHQSKGVGRALIEHAIGFFKRNGMRYVRIETLEQNERCLALYPRMGFAEVGRQVMYFGRID